MIVVTMTSWTKRINNVQRVLESILQNTLVPNRIYLNLSEEEFKNKEKDLPETLIKFIDENKEVIKLNWVYKNIKSFKKIFPILKYLSDEDIIINVDDDITLPDYYIERAVSTYNKYKTCITPVQATNPEGYAGGLLPEMHKWVVAGTVYTKSMLKHWEKFICPEVLSTNHDDALYDFLIWLNGYDAVSGEGYSNRSFNVFWRSDAIHGSLGCANAEKATKINIERFIKMYGNKPKFNYFNENIDSERIRHLNDDKIRELSGYKTEIKIEKAVSNDSYSWEW